MEERFRPVADEPVSEDEMREILVRIHDPGPLAPKIPDARLTLGAIHEVTTANLEDLAAILAAIRQEQRESNVNQLLNEFEEPTYRVERPGNPPIDPLSRKHPNTYFRSIPTILDRIAQRERVEIVVKEDPEKIASERRSHMFAMTVLLMIALIAIAIIFHR